MSDPSSVQLKDTSYVTAVEEQASKYRLEMEFDWINKRLIGPPVSGMDYGFNTVDYKRWYTAEDIEASINFMDQHADVILPFAKSQLETRGREAKMKCDNVATKCNEQFVEGLERERCKANGVLDGGGWCLTHDTERGLPLHNTGYNIPYHHVLGSQALIQELSSFIVEENIASINDFGAGVGQYKPEILQRHPNMVYEAYDGAGNVNEYTNGNVDFFDLTLPLGLPKSEWVMSLEVGEHVPSMFEGMVIRNLHRHNTKGIILSWGVLGQGGHSHVNNHSNEYIIEIFERLGYTYLQDWTARFRQSKGIYSYFKESIMVFKRNQ